MKSSLLLLTSSLAANAALFGALAWRPALAPPAFRDFFARNFHVADAALATPSSPVVERAPPARPLWTLLQTDDLRTLVARLRAAGFPPAVIREILRTQVNARYNSRLTALMEPDPKVPYWRVGSSFYGVDAKRNEEINQLQRDRAKALRDLLTDDFFATGDVTAAQRRQFGDLPRQKIDALQRIEDDYTEMMSQVRAGMNGITLPEDKAKLALLIREKQTDLAAVLTPAELADYTMRTSPITNLLRTRLDTFDPSAGEFQAIFQTQQALNDKLSVGTSGGNVSAGDFQQRQAAQAEVEAQLKTALGDARYAEYSRAVSSEFQQLSRLAQRDNLPAAAAVQAYTARDQVTVESNRIFDDNTLSVDQKLAALQSLAQNTRAQLLATLGPTSGPAYVKIADQWLTNVERGSAVSFNSGGGGITTMTTNNGVTSMVSLGGSYPSFRRLPGAFPAPRPATNISNPRP